MTEKFHSVRGMKDSFSEEAALYEMIEEKLKKIFTQWGFDPVRLPIIEDEKLFKKSIGAGTDMIDKEMYCFEDKNDKRLTLRPEGTAGVVRAAIQSGQVGQGLIKWFYLGPMFRRERPQKGRYRQFYQLGAEVLGASGVGVVAEVIALGTELLSTYSNITLHLNYISEPGNRARYIRDLTNYLTPYANNLDQDSQRRLTINPLRILDSKCPETQAILKQAPMLANYLPSSEKTQIRQLEKMLNDMGIAYQIDPTLVRGLDYYNGFVFEWHQKELLGTQSAVAAGGCYDHLVQHLGGPKVDACGFAIGIDRLVELMKNNDNSGICDMDGLILAHDPIFFNRAYQLHQVVRQKFTSLRVGIDCRQQSLKSLLRRAKTIVPKWIVTLDDEHILVQFDDQFVKLKVDQWDQWLKNYNESIKLT
ncbi:histidine--tRNA ligase [Gammaproteobacteria bacterium]|nr:histidine--tRNA ligase [Gammaproteobacteria bacterium]